MNTRTNKSRKTSENLFKPKQFLALRVSFGASKLSWIAFTGVHNPEGFSFKVAK